MLALTKAQHDGWACVWCGMPLRKNAVSAGIARGRMGAHDLSVEVYACPVCAEGIPQAPIRPRTP